MSNAWRIKYWDSEHTRVTVEEVTETKYIATVWDKKYCLEVDREVYEFETFGGAVDKAFDIMAAFLNDAEAKLLRQARHTASANRIGKKIRRDLRTAGGAE